MVQQLKTGDSDSTVISKAYCFSSKNECTVYTSPSFVCLYLRITHSLFVFCYIRDADLDPTIHNYAYIQFLARTVIFSPEYESTQSVGLYNLLLKASK